MPPLDVVNMPRRPPDLGGHRVVDERPTRTAESVVSHTAPRGVDSG